MVWEDKQDYGIFRNEGRGGGDKVGETERVEFKCLDLQVENIRQAKSALELKKAEILFPRPNLNSSVELETFAGLIVG